MDTKEILNEISKLRDRFLDTSARNPLNNQRLSSNSKTKIRIVGEIISILIYKLISGKELRFHPIDKGYEDEFIDQKIKDILKTVEFIDHRNNLIESNDELKKRIKYIENKIKDPITRESELAKINEEIDNKVLKEKYNIDNKKKKYSIQELATLRDISLTYELRVKDEGTKDKTFTDNNIETLLYGKDLFKILKNIKSKYNKILNETSSSCVYLTCGNIKYKSSRDSNKTYYAPLLLLRLNIDENKASKDYDGYYKYKIVSDDDSIILNRSLQKLLEKNYQIVLDDFDSDLLSGASLEDYSNYISKYFNKLSKKIKQSNDLEFYPYCTIDIFNNDRINQWNDMNLDEWNGKIEDAKNIIDLFSGNNSSSSDNTGSYEEIELSKNKIFREDVPETILQSDVSQHNVILSALEGKSMVVQGPPGTGKSQTIANLLVHLSRKGKKILFMAAKKPALDVVYDKLKEQNLESICLRLYTSGQIKNEGLMKERLHSQLLKRLGKKKLNKNFNENRIKSDKEILIKNVDKLDDYYNKIVGDENIDISFTDIDYDSISILNAISILVNIDLKFKFFTKISNDPLKYNSLSDSIFNNFKESFNSVKNLINYIEDNNLKDHKNILSSSLFNLKDYANIEEFVKTIEELMSYLDSINNNFIKIHDQFNKKEIYTEDLRNLKNFLDMYKELIIDYPELKLKDFYINNLKSSELILEFIKSFKNYSNDFEDECNLKDIKNLLSNADKIIKLYDNLDQSIDDYFNFKIIELDSNVENLKTYNKSLTSFKKIDEKFKPILEIDDTKSISEKKLLYEKLYNLFSEYGDKSNLFKYISKDINKDIQKFFSGSRGFTILHPCVQSNFFNKGLFNDFYNFFSNLTDKDNYDKEKLYGLEFKGILKNINNYIFKNNKFPSLIKRKIFGMRNFREFISIMRRYDVVDEIDELLKIKPASKFDKKIESLINDFKNVIAEVEIFISLLSSDKKLKSTFCSFIDVNPDIGSILYDSFDEDPYSFLEKIIEFSEVINLNISIQDFIKTDQNFLKILKNNKNIDLINEWLHSDEVDISSLMKSLNIESLNNYDDYDYIFDQIRILKDIGSYFLDNKNLFNKNMAINSFFTNSEIINKNIINNDKFKYIVNDLQSTQIKYFSNDKFINTINPLKNLKLIDPDQIEYFFDNIDNKFGEILTILNQIDNFNESINKLVNYGITDDHDFINDGISINSLDINQRLDAYRSILKFVETEDFKHLRNIQPLFTNKDVVNDYLKYYDNFSDLTTESKDFLLYKYLIKSINKFDKNNPNVLKVQKPLIDEFIENLKKVSKNTKVELQHHINLSGNLDFLEDGNKSGRVASFTEKGLISHFLYKPKMKLSMRRIIKQAFKSFSQLYPCIITNPGGVSRFLPQTFGLFDVVIMDEASQLRLEDAVPALIRGTQFIIAGDSQQLPPSDYFQAEDDEVEFEDETISDVKSLLEFAESSLSLSGSIKSLLCHYRSEYAELIEFSNKKIYKNQLVIPPSAISLDASKCIEYHYLDHSKSSYKTGITTNMGEINAIKSWLENFVSIDKNHEKSILIVAMNKNQQENIEILIEQLRSESNNFRKYFDFWENKKNGVDQLIVQNLESVQGDERDIVIVSTVYGPVDGQVFQRFGDINKEVGYKRINVMITRQRSKLVTFTSLKHTDILNPKTRGLETFKDFLYFVENKSLPLSPDRDVIQEPESYFEESVINMMELRSFFSKYRIDTQVKVQGFRIDLGIYDRESGYYVLGVECDGASYHSSMTAKDRDYNRQKILESKGWRIHRIWSTDWFTDPENEINKIENVLKEMNQINLI